MAKTRIRRGRRTFRRPRHLPRDATTRSRLPRRRAARAIGSETAPASPVSRGLAARADRLDSPKTPAVALRVVSNISGGSLSDYSARRSAFATRSTTGRTRLRRRRSPPWRSTRSGGREAASGRGGSEAMTSLARVSQVEPVEDRFDPQNPRARRDSRRHTPCLRVASHHPRRRRRDDGGGLP